MIIQNFPHITAGLLLMLLLVSQAALGDNTPDDGLSPSFYDELQWLREESSLVTASRQKEKVATAPGMVMVISRSQIQQRGYLTLIDLLQDIPGMDIQKYLSSHPYRLTVRGVTGNNKILLLQDGARIGAASNTELLPIDHNYPLYHAKQVEIVMGASSALYGADAFTGVINIITRDAADADMDKAEIHIEAGEFDSQRLHITGGKVFSRQFALTFGGHIQKADNPDLSSVWPELYPLNDLVDFNGNTIVPARQRDGYRADSNSHSAFAKLQLPAHFLLGWYHSAYDQPSSYGDLPDTVDYTANSRAITLLDTLYLQQKHKFDSHWNSNIQLTWSRYEVDEDSSFSNLFTGFAKEYKYAKSDRLQLEPQLTWKDDQHSLITGLNFEQLKTIPYTADLDNKYDPDNSSSNQNIYYPGSNGNLPVQIYSETTHNRGIFIQLKSAWRENFSTTLGLRYDKNQEYNSSINPRVSLVYLPQQNSTFKLSWGKAFLEPSPLFKYAHFGTFTGAVNSEGLYESFFFRIPNEKLKPEQMQSLELQFIHKFKQGIKFSANAYQQKVSDMILPEATNPLVSDYIPSGIVFFTDNFNNIGEMEALGIDLTLNILWKFRYSTLDLWSNASYVDGELKSESSSYSVPLPYSSRKKANFGLTWNYKNSIILTPSLRWTGKSAAFITNRESEDYGYSIPSWSRLNLYAEIRNIAKSELSLHLRIQNLLDTQYSNAGTTASTTFHKQPQDPRWVHVGLRYRF